MPRAEPWITGDLIKPEIVDDLSVLATLDQISEQLSPRLRDQVQTSIRAAVTQQDLPAEVTLQIGERG